MKRNEDKDQKKKHKPLPNDEGGEEAPLTERDFYTALQSASRPVEADEEQSSEGKTKTSE